MADIRKGLPVRSEQDPDQKVQVKIVDFTTPAQGAIVDTDSNLHVEIHGDDPGGTDRVIRTSEEGHISINGIYSATLNTNPSKTGLVAHTRGASLDDTTQAVRNTGGVPADDIPNANISALDVLSFQMVYDDVAQQWDRVTATGGSINVNVTNSPEVEIDGVYDGTNLNPDNIGVVWHSRAVTPGDTNQLLRPTGVNSTVNTNVWAIDVAIRDEDGNPFTLSNPLPVVTSDSTGDDIHDYDTAAAVVAAAISNHDYTVTAGKTFLLRQFGFAASGRGKFELQIETAPASGVFNSRVVGFTTEAEGNDEITLATPIEVAAGVIVRIVRTNRDDDDQDLYSWVNGSEI